MVVGGLKVGKDEWTVEVMARGAVEEVGEA